MQKTNDIHDSAEPRASARAVTRTRHRSRASARAAVPSTGRHATRCGALALALTLLAASVSGGKAATAHGETPPDEAISRAFTVAVSRDQSMANEAISRAFTVAVSYDQGMANEAVSRAFTVLVPGPSPVAWRSVRTHSSAGDLGIELDPAASGSAVVSETRQGGIQKIEVDFDGYIAHLPMGTIEAENLTHGGTIEASSQYTINSGMTLVVEFDAGLPDQACYRINLAGDVLGLKGDTDCLVKGLAGDTNGDNYTDLIDMAQVKSKNGQPVVPDNIRFDVNLDGHIDLIDMALIKSLNGGSVSCP